MLGFRGSKSDHRVTLTEVFPGSGNVVMFSVPLERERGVGVLTVEGPKPLKAHLGAHLTMMAMQDDCWSPVREDDELGGLFITYDYGSLKRRISPIQLLSAVLLESLAKNSLLLVSQVSKLIVVNGEKRFSMAIPLPRGITNGKIELTPLVVRPTEFK